MTLCAKIDYIGIVWYVCVRYNLFLSLVISSVIYYGFQYNTNADA